MFDYLVRTAVLAGCKLGETDSRNLLLFEFAKWCQIGGGSERGRRILFNFTPPYTILCKFPSGLAIILLNWLCLSVTSGPFTTLCRIGWLWWVIEGIFRESEIASVYLHIFHPSLISSISWGLLKETQTIWQMKSNSISITLWSNRMQHLVPRTSLNSWKMIETQPVSVLNGFFRTNGRTVRVTWKNPTFIFFDLLDMDVNCNTCIK